MNFIEHVNSELEKYDVEVEPQIVPKGLHTDTQGHFHVVTKEEEILADVTDSSITVYGIASGTTWRLIFYEIVELYNDRTGIKIRVRVSKEPHEEV